MSKNQKSIFSKNIKFKDNQNPLPKQELVVIEDNDDLKIMASYLRMIINIQVIILQYTKIKTFIMIKLIKLMFHLISKKGL